MTMADFESFNFRLIAVFRIQFPDSFHGEELKNDLRNINSFSNQRCPRHRCLGFINSLVSIFFPGVCGLF